MYKADPQKTLLFYLLSVWFPPESIVVVLIITLTFFCTLCLSPLESLQWMKGQVILNILPTKYFLYILTERLLIWLYMNTTGQQYIHYFTRKIRPLPWPSHNFFFFSSLGFFQFLLWFKLLANAWWVWTFGITLTLNKNLYIPTK